MLRGAPRRGVTLGRQLKRRFFILSNDTLRYFVDETLTEEKGVIPLLNVRQTSTDNLAPSASAGTFVVELENRT